MRPDQIALLLEGIRHSLPIGQVPIEAANKQQPRISTDFGRMTIAAIWRKYFLGIVLYYRHFRVSYREDGLAVKSSEPGQGNSLRSGSEPCLFSQVFYWYA